VYKNGLLTLNRQLFPSSPRTLPAYTDIDIVAPLWTDFDSSELYIEEFSGARVLQRATNDIRQYFPQTNFTADSVFACTWDNVRYRNTSAQVRSVFIISFLVSRDCDDHLILLLLFYRIPLFKYC